MDGWTEKHRIGRAKKSKTMHTLNFKTKSALTLNITNKKNSLKGVILCATQRVDENNKKKRFGF